MEQIWYTEIIITILLIASVIKGTADNVTCGWVYKTSLPKDTILNILLYLLDKHKDEIWRSKNNSRFDKL